MSHASDNPVRCADTSCAAQHPSGKWGNIKAAADGWFHAKDGTAYCPSHVPKWVRTWRAR
jgi:hypothetical protein